VPCVNRKRSTYLGRVHVTVMGKGQQKVSPPSQSSNEVKKPKSITALAEDYRQFKDRISFKKEVAEISEHSRRSIRKASHFLSVGTSDQKWQRANMVIGALEVKSDPFLQPKEDMKPHYKSDGGTSAPKFEAALLAWQDLKLRKSFIRACADLPEFVCCCGLYHSNNISTAKQYASLLNEGWVKHANSKMKARGFKIDAFLWNWQSSSGNTSKNILLIRFFELSTYKFRRASEEGSLDLDDMLLDDRRVDDSSHYSASHNTDEEKPNSEQQL